MNTCALPMVALFSYRLEGIEVLSQNTGIMLTKLVMSICTISLLPKTSLSQYYSNQYYQNVPQHYYPRQPPEPTDMDYEEPMEHEYRRHGRPNMYARPPPNSRIDKDDDEYEADADYDDCKCSCIRCKTNPHKPCCTEVCQTCEEMRQSQQIEPPANPPLQQAQGSVLFVPYPYPLMVPNNNVKNDPKTSSTTTTTTTTTTTEEPDRTPRELKKIDKELHQKKSSDETNLYKNQMMKNERRYMLTTVRKTKPAWEPKYGIVPIPDTLAEKLMNQLKQDHGRKM